MIDDSESEGPGDENETPFEYLGECAGCDVYAAVNAQGLCEECAAKLERDLIRLGDWDYTTIGFLLPEEERDAHQAKVIAKFGWEMELIADERPSSKPRRKQQRKRARKRGRRKSK